MPRWWVFPPRAAARLYYTATPEGLRLLVRSYPQNGDKLRRGNWQAVPGMAGAWTNLAAREGEPDPVPSRWFRALGGRLEDLSAAEIERRYRLRGCPRSARIVGINEVGEEVRESGGRRWTLWPGMIAGQSWAGSETAHPAHRVLRLGNRACYQRLAEQMAASATRGRLRMEDEAVATLAAELIDPGQRRSFKPWTNDAEESRELLLEEIAAAALRGAEASARPLWTEAVTLERSVPALARLTGNTPPLVIASAAAAVAGPLREVALKPGRSSDGWARLFGGGGDAPCIFDGRRMPPAAASAALVELAEQRQTRLVALLSEDPESPDLRIAREHIAQRRGMEAALHLPEEVTGGEAVTLLSIGLPRPAILPDAPPQSMRVIRGEAQGDIRRWLDESLRGRRRLAGEDDNDSRLAPYVPISRLGVARCMISRGQQAAAAVAGRKCVDVHGPVDAFVSGLLDMPPDQLEQRFSPEQIDAIAMAEAAHRRNRAFLLADQTGTGKGRALVGAAAAWLRGDPERRVLYMTVDQAVALDVLRDIGATGTVEAIGRPCLLGSKMPESEDSWTPDAAERRRMLDNRAWPGDSRFLVSTYSGYQSARVDDAAKSDAERRAADWLIAVAADPRTMLVLDECHKTLNADSNSGHNFRLAIGGAGRVMFATATALRSPRGVDLYRRLMPPDMSDLAFRHIREALITGGETAQESFIGMLVEDGVLLRRDHDVGLVPYSVATPDPGEEAQNRAAMAALRDVAEVLVSAHEEVAAWVARQWPGAIAAGDPAARNSAFRNFGSVDTVYVQSFGAPLDRIANATLTALKTDQVVRLAAAAIDRDRKPMISLSFTGASWLARLAAGAAEQPEGRPPDLRDRIRDIAESMFRVRRNEDVVPFDSRAESVRVRNAWRRLTAAIEAMPAGLPASPVDAIIEGLHRRGYNCAEITGREWLLTEDGRVEPRAVPRKEDVAHEFNHGDCDVLVYNAAGGTGASYHASAEFADQRPRSILQLEMPLDILAHLQSMGRGNRFDQVALPEFFTVSTDTVPEQRLLAITNRKLRTVGAILDGDRDHPALTRGIPDLFNGVGADAAGAVLAGEPALAHRLGLVAPAAADPNPRLVRSLFSRSILLPEAEQRRLFDLLTTEYEARIADLEAAGANPLKVPSMDGHVVIRETVPYTTDARVQQDVDTVFGRTLNLSTGVWHRLPGLSAEAVTAAALTARERIAAGDSAEDPRWQSRHLSARAQMLVAAGRSRDELQELIALLNRAAPGSVWQDQQGWESVIVDYTPPPPDMVGYAHAHRFRVARPGEPDFVTLRAAELRSRDHRSGGTNVLDAGDHAVLRSLNAFTQSGSRRPVQILSGDMLSVAASMQGHNSQHYRICTLVDQNGTSHRAAVNSGDERQLDLAMLPFTISARSMLDAARTLDIEDSRAPGMSWPTARQETAGSLARPEGNREYLMTLGLDNGTLRITLPRFTKRMREQFWVRGTGPELYRTMVGTDIPDRADPGHPVIRRQLQVGSRGTADERRLAERVCALLDRHPATELLAPGRMRDWWFRVGSGLHAGRIADWQPMSTEGLITDTLDTALTEDRIRPFLRVNWPGGDAEADCVPDSERPGLILSLPNFDRENAAFWHGEGGSELWQMTTADALPAKPLPPGGQRRTGFVAAADCQQAISILVARAGDSGGKLFVNPPAEPDRARTFGMAA